ncbi:uncharacterized protein NEMAJ01_1273 [Nematocida major]|uniref:uncharacterized protein n=1 Tax=Nematocida major TaxID=1912982 RepID=UPI0020074BD7|nr:uncharacterized protein NEMAJ01_1273 [Nematocida major]KAH9386377.1 hypothetical protein NEMAJ01_1273 [Nematocida major]
MDDDWEFLRRPSTAAPPRKQETVSFRVVFGGTEKECELLSSDTFESVYEHYEGRFGISIVLECNGVSLSRYAKAKVLLKGCGAPVLKVVVPEDAPARVEHVVYKIRYSQYECIQVEKKNMQTAGDLLRAAQKSLSTLPRIEAAYLEFDGAVLEETQELDSVLENGDLIDLLRK